MRLLRPRPPTSRRAGQFLMPDHPFRTTVDNWCGASAFCRRAGTHSASRRRIGSQPLAGRFEHSYGTLSRDAGKVLEEVVERRRSFEMVEQILHRDAYTREAQCGVGPTAATAIIASIGSGHEFHCGRQLSAWLDLVSGQYRSGGKTRLGRITKAGDAYPRSLLVLTCPGRPASSR